MPRIRRSIRSAVTPWLLGGVVTLEAAVADRDRRGPLGAIAAQVLGAQQAAGGLDRPASRWASSPA